MEENKKLELNDNELDTVVGWTARHSTGVTRNCCGHKGSIIETEILD